MDWEARHDAGAGLSPQATVEAIAAKSERFETSTPFGAVVWRRWGEGAPLLLLHGAHGSWLHWIRNIEDLAADQMVIAPDLPGFGDSASPGNDASAADIAAPVANIIRAMGLSGVRILGFSFGGLIGCHVAAQASEVVERVIIIDTGGLGTPVVQPDLISVRKHRSEAEAHRHNLRALMLHDPGRVDALALHVQALNVMRGRIDVRSLISPDGTIRALRMSDVPVDAIWGEWDRPHPDPESQFAALRRERPDARGRVIANAGHWSPYENPRDFARQCRELLEAGRSPIGSSPTVEPAA